MITSKICNVCNKKAILRREFNLQGTLYQDFECGHVQVAQVLSARSFDGFQSLDGKKPFTFQIKGAAWAVNSNGRFLIMDEMGLGKTIQFLMVADSLKRTKFLLLCKSSLKVQWSKETYRWCNEALTQIIESEQEFLLPSVKGYIVSYDLLWRFKDIPAFMKRLGVNLVGLDEVQHLKNTDSKRTNCVREVCKHVDYIGALSGTPIKNSAAEFFPILNLLHPEKFPTLMNFQRLWIESYWNGYTTKSGGLKDWNKFHEYTKDFILRRTREEVLPDLPKVSRDFRFSDLGVEVEEAYKDLVKEFQANYNGKIEDNILAYLSKMRHLTGMAKIQPVVEYTQDFIEETDRKLVIFVHHKDVAFAVLSQLRNLQRQNSKYGTEILSLTSDMSPEQRDGAVQKFWKSDYRIMVASTLASGEGLNLQCCDACIMMERQWNPANEEQAESRFIRIGQQSNKVDAMYPIAVGTVDEFFAEIIEKKRSICSNTLDGKEYVWDQSSIMKDLADAIALNGGREWGF